MKVILDCDPGNMGAAMNFVFKAQQEYPNQKIGTGNAVVYTQGTRKFSVVRNQGSYTVKQGK